MRSFLSLLLLCFIVPCCIHTTTHIVQAGTVHGNEHIQFKIRRGEIPCRGVNLGGWLVAEQWMTWDSPIWQDVPSNYSSIGEFATMKYLGHSKGDKRFEKHRSQWITEKDIAEIASYGLNTVRVPIGFWIMGLDRNDPAGIEQWKTYAPGALKYLDRLINEWALKYNVAVMLSFHAHKGSQNGRDHSAPTEMSVKFWSFYPENIQNSIEVSTFLAARYQKSPAFLGLNLMNEPEYDTNPEIVRNYYLTAYKLIRQSGNDCVLIVSPMLTEQNPSVMQDFMRWPNYINVWHEWHPYFVWGYEGKNEDQILDSINGTASNIRAWHGNWLFIGEWSLGSPVSAPFHDVNKYKQFATRQLEAWKNAHQGFTFWSWKHSNDMHKMKTGWSMRQLLRDGIIKF
jgi:glucan 1,3-beta-glucosidase